MTRARLSSEEFEVRALTSESLIDLCNYLLFLYQEFDEWGSVSESSVQDHRDKDKDDSIAGSSASNGSSSKKHRVRFGDLEGSSHSKAEGNESVSSSKKADLLELGNVQVAGWNAGVTPTVTPLPTVPSVSRDWLLGRITPPSSASGTESKPISYCTVNRIPFDPRRKSFEGVLRDSGKHKHRKKKRNSLSQLDDPEDDVDVDIGTGDDGDDNDDSSSQDSVPAAIRAVRVTQSGSGTRISAGGAVEDAPVPTPMDL